MTPREELSLEDPDPGTRDPACPAYARIPGGAKKGVVVIHEIFGPQPEIERVVERLAAAGYAAIAPDLFHHGRVSCMRSVMGAMKTGEDVPAVRQARRARAWLSERAGLAPSQIGIIGFCFGGGFALLAGKGWGAVSANYGVCPEPHVLEGLGPTIACYGGRDRSMRAAQHRLEKELPRLGPQHEMHVFEGAGHSFLTDGHHPIAAALSWPLMHVKYDRDRAEDGWKRILSFFDRALGDDAHAH